MKEIKLGSHTVGKTPNPYVIAEIGVNHEGSYELACKLIELAKEGGAQAAKFQSYKAHTLASKHSPSYWDRSKEPTASQFELFQKYDKFGPTEYVKLAEHCKKVGIDFLSTPFDDEAIDFLEPLVSFYKIASADLTNHPFLRKVAAKKKNVVLSTGCSTLFEIQQAVGVLNANGCPEVALLHCVLNYPTPDENAHLNMIEHLQEAFPSHVIGYSDHTHPDMAMTTLVHAYEMGSRILEKHFTHDKTLPGNDHYHAMNCEDLQRFFYQVRKINTLNGATFKRPLEAEKPAIKNARRSLVLQNAVKAGTPIKESDLTYKRPGHGISPKYFSRVVGRCLKTDQSDDHVLKWEDLQPDTTKEFTVAMVQARMGSQRFPGKMLTQLGGHTLLEWVLLRMKLCTQVDKLILATSDHPDNDRLEEAAFRLGIETFRGEEDDVLSRFVHAANDLGADSIVRICGDNPFIAPEEVDRLVKHFKANRPDYAFNHIPKMDNNYPDGLGAEILSYATLQKINLHASEQKHREHLTSYIWDNLDSFKVQTLKAPENISHPEFKFDIDTPKDWERLSVLAQQLTIQSTPLDIVMRERAILSNT